MLFIQAPDPIATMFVGIPPERIHMISECSDVTTSIKTLAMIIASDSRTVEMMNAGVVVIRSTERAAEILLVCGDGEMAGLWAAMDNDPRLPDLGADEIRLVRENVRSIVHSIDNPL